MSTHVSHAVALVGQSGNMAETAGLSVFALPWSRKTRVATKPRAPLAKGVFESHLGTNTNAFLGVCGSKRPQGSRGRSLRVHFPELEFQRGDRLELCIACPDWSIVDDVDVAQNSPELLFWRPSAETIARHRCPLFSRRTFVGLDILCIDEMQRCTRASSHPMS